MDQLICASLSHTQHYWYEVGMLKVPAIYVRHLFRFHRRDNFVAAVHY